MMKRTTAALILLFMLVAGRTVFSVKAQSGQFIIQGADEINTLSFTASVDLTDLIAQTAPRIVFQHAHRNRNITLAAIPGALSDLLAQTAPRIVFQHAHRNRHITLTAIPFALSDLLAGIQPRLIFQHAQANRYLALTSPPTQLNTLVAQLLPRIVFQHAHANRNIEIRYPVALIGDTTPPQVSQISVEMLGENNAIVTWTTDEYADSTVQCGIAPGAYTMTFFDPLYVKQHDVTLTGLTAGTTYYCRCSSTDLSGNTTHSQEFSFEQAAQPATTITKRVSPEGQVQFGDELAYTLVISGVTGAEVGIYDPLIGTTFVRFTEKPAGIEFANDAITGTMTIAPTNQMTISFVVQVGVPGTVGIYVDVSNTACVYPAGQTISACAWSNTVTNQAYRPYTVFLPLVVRTQ